MKSTPLNLMAMGLSLVEDLRWDKQLKVSGGEEQGQTAYGEALSCRMKVYPASREWR